MGSISAQCIHHHHRNHHHRNPISIRLSPPPPPSPSILPFPPHRAPLHKLRHICAFKTKPDWSRIGSTSTSGGTSSSNSTTTTSSSSSLDGKHAAELLRKPIVSPSLEGEGEVSGKETDDEEEEDQVKTENDWVDWEDQILEDTVPLVGFVRMILHSGKYENGERLSPEHEKTILERLLPYHPQCEKKIGSGVDYITSGYHPDFETSRCLFIVRKDGERVDFSYWKCIKGLIKKNYPLYADSFINKHFRNPRRTD